MICLSFDTDRMTPEGMVEFLGTTPIPGRATFFCTERYDSLEASGHELCPHVYLAAGVDWDVTLNQARNDYPTATGWRSHSCVFSHILAEQLATLGYEYVSIHDELGKTDLEPHRHAWGLWHLPIYYMDNLDFSMPRFWGESAPAPFDRRLIEDAVNGNALFVFAFHPIHIALNSPSAEEYFERRDRVAQGMSLADASWEGVGTRDFYLELCSTMEQAGQRSSAMRDALDAYRTSAVGSRA